MTQSEVTTTNQADLMPLTDLDDGEAWAMVEASPDGMILADEHGVMIHVNARIETLFGYDRADLLGRSVEMLIPQRNRQVHSAHRTRYRAQPKVRAMGAGLELLACRCDESEFPVEVSLSPFTTHEGLRVVATVRDITERLSDEEHSHAVLHTIDAAQDGLFMFTSDTLEFRYVNQGGANHLGYSREELLTMTPMHIKPEFTERSFREVLQPLLDGKIDSHVFTTTHRRKDGQDLPVEIILEFPPAASPNRARMFVAIVHDITERLRAEEAIINNEASLRMLEDRERLARDLHDVVIQRLFAAGMSLQSVEPLITDPEAAIRVTQTVNELDQTIAELRAAIFQLTTRDLPVATLINNIVRHAAQRLDFEPELTVDGDQERIPDDVVEQLLPVLTEALSNIVRHADATAADVLIEVRTDQVCLTVRDNGVGIEETGSGGHGLENLRARAKKTGGSFDIFTTPDGDGTTLTWMSPV